MVGLVQGTADLVVVANRLPVRRVTTGDGVRWETSPGGLVGALAPILQRRSGSWVGWVGDDSAGDSPFDLDGMQLVPLSLSPEDISAFYEGFSNGTLWPLYHDAIRPPEFHREWWRQYVAVNQRYADAAARVAGPGAMVWVHDYQLQLVPQMLRELRPDLCIGFFLHIPFPPQELFMRLPWRRELLEGVLGADVVGFQVPVAAQNFAVLARRLTRASGAVPTLQFRGRTVRVDAFPVSIDVDRYEELAAAPSMRDEVAAVRERLGNPGSILLGVDRLDYTKGIEARLKAFRELLVDGEVSVPGTVLVQIAVPSREDVAAYGEERDSIERLVGEINGDFGQMGAPAVQYFHRSIGIEELVALYCAADIMLVTPYRDGMNLVAKEYVACRVDDGGQLILSEFAGAARELTAARLVNPHDTAGMKEAVVGALHTSPSAARRRMTRLRRSVRSWTVHDWADSFITAMTDARDAGPGRGGPAGSGAASGGTAGTDEATGA